MMATSMVHVRVNSEIKEQAGETLAAMGMTVSDAVRMFLTRVVADKELPFTPKVPNAETQAAMAEVHELIRSRRARSLTAEELFDELDKNASQ